MNNWNKQIFVFLFSTLLYFGFSPPVFAAENSSIPYLPENVYFIDTTGTIPQKVIDQANEKAKVYNEKGIEITGWFLSDSSLTLRQLSTDFGNINKIGSNNQDKAVVVTIATDRVGSDGRKPSLFVGVGKGLKNQLSDIESNQIKKDIFDIAKTESSTSWHQGFLNIIDKLGDILTTKSENKSDTITGNSLLDLTLFGILIICSTWFLLYCASEASNSSNSTNKEVDMSSKDKKKKKPSTYTSSSTSKTQSSNPVYIPTDYGFYDSGNNVSSNYTSSPDTSSYDSGGSFDGGGGGDL